jgi:hypothetical protein
MSACLMKARQIRPTFDEKEWCNEPCDYRHDPLDYEDPAPTMYAESVLDQKRKYPEHNCLPPTVYPVTYADQG